MHQRKIERWNRKLADLTATHAGHPLLAELETLLGNYGKLERRLDKVASISDKMQNEMLHLHEALRASEARFRLVADNAQDVLWKFDLTQERISYVSPSIERLTGYAVEESMALSLDASFTPTSAQRLRETLDYLATHEQARKSVVTLERRCKEGSTVWTEDTVSVVQTEQGRPTEVVCVARDITARRKSQEEQKRFVAMVSHEFRTPLAIIGTTIELLMVTTADLKDTTRREYSKIQKAVSRLTALLDHYLTEDRLDAARRGLDLQNTAALALLTDSQKSAQALSNEHRISVENAGTPDTILCDIDLMRLTLRVLTDNAVKYTPAGSHIELVCRPAPQGGVEFVVSDNGPGIPEDELASVFDKFFRGRRAADKPGSGLGLHLAQCGAQAHGGTLTARNRPAGGAEFSVWLPGKAVDNEHN